MSEELPGTESAPAVIPVAGRPDLVGCVRSLPESAGQFFFAPELYEELVLQLPAIP